MSSRTHNPTRQPNANVADSQLSRASRRRLRRAQAKANVQQTSVVVPTRSSTRSVVAPTRVQVNVDNNNNHIDTNDDDDDEDDEQSAAPAAAASGGPNAQSAAVTSGGTENIGSSDDSDDHDGGGRTDSAASTNNVNVRTDSAESDSNVTSALDVTNGEYQRQLFESQLVQDDRKTDVIIINMMHFFPPTSARRAKCDVTSVRVPLTTSTIDQRKLAFISYRTACPTGNFIDFLFEIRDNLNPDIEWDIEDDQDDDDDQQNNHDTYVNDQQDEDKQDEHDYSDDDERDRKRSRIEDDDSDYVEPPHVFVRRTHGAPASAPPSAAAAAAPADSPPPSSSAAPSSSSSSSSSSPNTSIECYSPCHSNDHYDARTTSRTGDRTNASSTSTSPPVTFSCPFTFDDYGKINKEEKDWSLSCIEKKCKLLRKDHRRHVHTSSSSFKMPPPGSFPTFRDRNDELMSDAHEFLVKLDRQLKLHDVPADRYGMILISCITDRIMADWVEKNIVGTCTSWDDVKRRFKEKYNDPALKNQLLAQLKSCTQRVDERVQHYFERFQSLVIRISGGTSIDTVAYIDDCISGMTRPMRTKIAEHCAFKAQASGKFEFATLQELFDTATTLERGLTPSYGRYNTNDNNNGNRKRRDRNHRVRINHIAPTATAAVNKIEMTPTGQPTNVNKKHKSHKKNTSTRGRGGNSRGGFNGGRGGFSPGRGGSVPAAVALSNTTGQPVRGSAEQWPSRYTSQRGNTSNKSSGGKRFDGTCNGCGKYGHKVVDCRSTSRDSPHGNRQ